MKDRVLNFAKKIYRKLFLPKLSSAKNLDHIFEVMGDDYVSERSIMLGDKKMRIRSLTMEATPGTVETVISILQSYPKEFSLLDYGCGQHQSAYLKNMGFKVHSCDILDFSGESYTKIDPQTYKLPFADNQFDATIFSEVIEHLESPWETLKELIRVTKHKIIITTPNVVSKKSKQVFSETGYFYWFTPDVDYHISPVPYWQLENFCKRHGIKISQLLGNHQIFGLMPDRPMLDNAEVLIFELDLSTKHVA